jgi:hypothetical protein
MGQIMPRKARRQAEDLLCCLFGHLEGQGSNADHRTLPIRRDVIDVDQPSEVLTDHDIRIAGHDSNPNGLWPIDRRGQCIGEPLFSHRSGAVGLYDNQPGHAGLVDFEPVAVERVVDKLLSIVA